MRQFFHRVLRITSGKDETVRSIWYRETIREYSTVSVGSNDDATVVQQLRHRPDSVYTLSVATIPVLTNELTARYCRDE